MIENIIAKKSRLIANILTKREKELTQLDWNKTQLKRKLRQDWGESINTWSKTQGKRAQTNLTW